VSIFIELRAPDFLSAISGVKPIAALSKAKIDERPAAIANFLRWVESLDECSIHSLIMDDFPEKATSTVIVEHWLQSKHVVLNDLQFKEFYRRFFSSTSRRLKSEICELFF
jgi:hypothetical protein